MPGFSVEESVLYPDMAALQEVETADLQPMQIGAHFFSVSAKFGVNNTLQSGLDNNSQTQEMQTSINQMQEG